MRGAWGEGEGMGGRAAEVAEVRGEVGNDVGGGSAGRGLREAGDGSREEEGEEHREDDEDEQEARRKDRVVGKRQFCRKHSRAGQVCLDYKCSLCGDYGHWRRRCPILRASKPTPVALQSGASSGDKSPESVQKREMVAVGCGMRDHE